MNIQDIDTLLKTNEEKIRQICSPFNGNCFEVSYALNHLFNSKIINFCCVYAEPQFVNQPKILPLHITVNINGTLFDAGGKLMEEQLLTEFAPNQNLDLISYEINLGMKK